MTHGAPTGAPPNTRAASAPPPGPEAAPGVRWIIGFAAAVAAVIALSPPLGYYLLSHQAEKRDSLIAARLHAAFLTQVIVHAGDSWQADIDGLIETDLAPAQLPERRSVLDTAGRVVSASGAALPPPLITSRTELIAARGPVGEVLVERSAWPLVQRALWIALASVSLAGAVFAALVLFPLRALRQTIAAVRREESQARARVQAEENLRMVFQHAVDGILMLDRQGLIVSSNPAARVLLGAGLAGPLEGQPVRRWFDAVQGVCEIQVQGPQQRPLSLEVTVTASTVDDQPQWVAIIRDITERRLNEQRLQTMAHVDALTGLPNRAMFRALLPEALQQAGRDGHEAALMFLDLDRFKAINDTLGHEAGDQLLQTVAQRLVAQVCGGQPPVGSDGAPTGDHLVFRLGGDEFTILLRRVRGAPAAREVAQRVLSAIAQPMVIGQDELQVSTSIGIALQPGPATDVDTWVKHADQAMYRAKSQGRNRCCVFGEAPQAASGMSASPLSPEGAAPAQTTPSA